MRLLQPLTIPQDRIVELSVCPFPAFVDKEWSVCALLVQSMPFKLIEDVLLPTFVTFALDNLAFESAPYQAQVVGEEVARIKVGEGGDRCGRRD